MVSSIEMLKKILSILTVEARLDVLENDSSPVFDPNGILESGGYGIDLSDYSDFFPRHWKSDPIAIQQLCPVIPEVQFVSLMSGNASSEISGNDLDPFVASDLRDVLDIDNSVLLGSGISIVKIHSEVDGFDKGSTLGMNSFSSTVEICTKLGMDNGPYQGYLYSFIFSSILSYRSYPIGSGSEFFQIHDIPETPSITIDQESEWVDYSISFSCLRNSERRVNR